MIRLALLFLLLPCIHPPKGFDGSVLQSSQSAIIFWREGREELILKIQYEAASSASKNWNLSKEQKVRFGKMSQDELRTLFLAEAAAEKRRGFLAKKDVEKLKESLTVLRSLRHRIDEWPFEGSIDPPSIMIKGYLDWGIKNGLLLEDSPWVSDFRFGEPWALRLEC